MDNINLNNDMLNNLKNMLGEQQVNEAISKISPEMIENFSNAMNSNNNCNEHSSNNNNNHNIDNDNFNFDNIDMATIMKLQTILNKMNNKKNDPRSNLLNSLKPYLRESRKENVDKYSNLLKIADLASLLNTENNDKKEDYPYNE